MSIKVKELNVSLGQLLLDPNNYRLDEGKDRERVSDENVVGHQESLLKKLVKENLADLKASILKNGFLEVDKIVVRELKNAGEGESIPKYLVIEGNRRTAAFKLLITEFYDKEKKKFLPNFPESLKEKYKSLNVLLVEGSDDEIEQYSQRLMGIRHVSGPKKWGGYQSGKLINDMFKAYAGDKADKYLRIGSFLGQRPKEVQLKHEAYLALEQMKKHPEYRSHASSTLFTLFHEMVTSSRFFKYDWLNWSDETMRFEHENRLKRVYDLMLPDELNHREIKNPTKMRELTRKVAVPEVSVQIEQGVRLSDVNYDFDEAKRITKIENFLNFTCSQRRSEISQEELELYSRLFHEIQRLVGGSS